MIFIKNAQCLILGLTHLTRFLFILFIYLLQWTLVSSTKQPEYLVSLSYFSDRFLLITQTSQTRCKSFYSDSRQNEQH